MVQIICVTNRKGGVGKTTMATHLAAGLATKGARVGLIDTDSQGHCALMFGVQQSNGLFKVMIEGSPLQDEVLGIPHEIYSPQDQPAQGALFLLPGYDKTYKIPHELEPSEIFLFYEMVHDFAELAQLDYVIIDSQPTMSQLDGSIYLAVDAFLYVTECEVLSIAGLQEVIMQMRKFSKQRQKRLGKETRIAGIIPNKYRTNTLTHQVNVGELGQMFGMFKDGGMVLSPMRLLTAWTQAANERVPMFVYEPTSEAAADAWRIVRSVEERVAQWL